jgi:amino acid transporter
MTSTMLASAIAQPRIPFAMSRDGLFPALFERLNRFATPYLLTILSGILAALLALFFTIEVLAELVSIGTLLAFSASCLCLLLVRVEGNPTGERWLLPLMLGSSLFAALAAVSVIYLWHLAASIILGLAGIGVAVPVFLFSYPNQPAKELFKTPLVPVVPILALWINLYMVASLHPVSWIRVAVWMGVGMLLYFAYGYRKSYVGHPERNPNTSVQPLQDEELAAAPPAPVEPSVADDFN